MSSSSTSHGYFESVSTQLSLSVGSSFEDVAGNSAANASQGVSAGVSAVDTGMNGKVIEERSMLYTSYKDYVKIPFLFQGQYYDEEIKLAYNRFRYYDPNTGNYICQDPIDLQGGMQLYAYIHDSNSWIDPFGLSGRGGTLHRSIQDQLRDDLKGLGKSVEAEGQIKLKNGQSRFGDLVVRNDVGDIIEVHQIGDMRTRGGFRPSSRERGAIMDIREALGDDVRIVFHDKKGRVTLIDPDKADDWKVPSKKHRKNSYG